MATDFRMPFSGNPLDRAGNLREDAAWLAEQISAPASRFLLLSGLEVLTRSATVPELAWLDGSFRAAFEWPGEPVLLGVNGGGGHFAVDGSGVGDCVTALGLEGAAG